MLAHVEKYRITELTMVPPIAVLLAKSPVVKDYDMSSVAFLGSGAAPLGREVCAEVEQLWPEKAVNVKQVRLYGSEVTPMLRLLMTFNRGGE